ncbi:MAG: protein jag [Clostridia bacterium]|nr:protein jag [Clostridia bacterium]
MLLKEIGTGRTVEAAIADGAKKLGVDPSRTQYEIIEAPKKGFLGFGEAPAKVYVFIEVGSEQTAVDYVKQVLGDMELNAEVEISRELNSEGGKILKIKGEEAGALIGHHGETLDALQYLSNLAVNRQNEGNEEEAPKITLDIEGYRARREETLRALAKRTADKVVRFRRNIALEPMTPYERRIVHSCLQEFRGVTTSSTGSDEERRVVIYYDAKTAGNYRGRNGNRGRNRDYNRGAGDGQTAEAAQNSKVTERSEESADE